MTGRRKSHGTDAGPTVPPAFALGGRGKQRGIKIGEVTYDEVPKELLMLVVKDKDRDFVVKTIIEEARTGEKGAFGDGKIFISPVDEMYTVSSGVKETGAEG